LSELTKTFYTGVNKRNIDNRIAPYYETINARASQISDHHEKQKFLKALYENFYRSYNPKASDRLGVIYTPEEIVNFMIESTDYLLFKHFEKTLGDPYTEILDPAVGTGTFITELIEYLPLNQLDEKYENDIHCNEVAILPYYIANLNIEYTYKQKTGKYKEFENICFVDTLDNMGFSKSHDHQLDMFGLFDENAERIGRQNTKKISVIIGNPPYNANQLNENENNKNRPYSEIDKRIKETYIKHSTAQKTKLYDMYARFYRWASDRINNNGIIAFITNRSFIDSRTFDGFRKVVEDEFSHIYIVDLGGDVRKNPKLSGPTHNVFAIQTGVAIAFFVKSPKKKNEKAWVNYSRRPELELAVDKLEFLQNTKFQELSFEHISPDKSNNWLNQPFNNWDKLLPLASKESKLSSGNQKCKTVFKLYSLGAVTNRDEWLLDFNFVNLQHKIKYFIDFYNSELIRWKNSDKKLPSNDFVDRSIKWTSELETHLRNGDNLIYNPDNHRETLYRPFIKMQFYFDRVIVHRLYQQHKIYPIGKIKGTNNRVIAISGISSSKPFSVLASNTIVGLDLLEKTQCFPYYFYNENNELIENISGEAQEKFTGFYKDKKIDKESIFTYIYAIFHNPVYRKTYKQNLKLEFPHIPFYNDFWKWCEWGKTLMDLHINYEQVAPYPLHREDLDPESTRKAIVPRLHARKDTAKIEIDTLTTLSGVPPEVWDYRLGTYSAIEWVLERYKEKTPKDPTIREKFNTYKFADYKEQVIDLICRVCTVSVETMKIINQMKKIEE